MTQKEQVYLAMERNGGYATFQQLNRIVDTSDWRTKTLMLQFEESFRIIRSFLD